MNKKQETEWEKEIDANYRAFKEILPELLENFPGKFVIMYQHKKVAIFDTEQDAFQAASMLYGKNVPYSVQKITNQSVDLGWQGCAFFGASSATTLP